MPSYRLRYFNARGFGEVCRLLFALADQEYEDVRYTQETWPEEKPKTPFGHVPVLEIDGKPYSESSAISRYLARTFGFYGKDNIEALEIDQVLGLVSDLIAELMKIFSETDETRKAELFKKAKEEIVPRFMSNFEKILKDNGDNGFYVGDKISLADVTMFDMAQHVQPYISYDDYPLMKRNRDATAANPRIKSWLEQRPVTEM